MIGLAPITSIADMHVACSRARKLGTLALVPTMGALHEGHLSLVRAARELCDFVAVSIFVNPAQFGPDEDLARYPRTLDRDLALLEREGISLVFCPSADEIYPSGRATTFVEVAEIGDRLDGKYRPGHFRGVATIVAKLFHIVAPDVALFGQKDAAQVAVLKAMVRDLNFPLELVSVPTVREPDGLAMSSRNLYLSRSDRESALTLHRALAAAEQAADRGICKPAALRNIMLEELNATPGLEVEYAEVVDPDTLLPVSDLANGALLAIAAHIGPTRLIDNILLPPASARYA
jgi:pantoate--beta-alanine ligase